MLSLATGARSEVILQYFETRWDEIYQRLPELAEVGYESLWTPPPGKSPIGGPYPFAYGGNVGYNSFDRFDLGDTPQRGSWETRYGSRTSLRNLVDNAHQSDIKIYPDIVFNHTGNGPDYRTYPGMLPQDFHGWNDAAQPGGFKRAPRMSVWTPDNGYGGTLNQELVSLMDIVLEFDGRFQGANSPNYAADPAPFIRHPGDYTKYPYNPTGTLPSENSRQFMVRWINWLGYAMDYDGVRLDAPKHVYKDFFGLPNQATDLKNQTFLYNIQRNFKERRLGRATNTPVSDITFADMYKNDIRRNDAMIFSEFFIGSQSEVDYWRNPSDRGWGIQTRYLDFPRKSALIMNAFNNGNLAALGDTTSGFSAEEGVTFAHSHDENPPNKLELAYAYILTHIGVPIVYFSGNNLKASEIGRAPGKNTWMNKGYDYALGDTVNGYQTGAIPNLVYIHNQFCRGKEYNRWTADNDFFAYERYDDLNTNGTPDSGEGLLLVALNDSGSDQTRNGIQTSFAPGTILKDYTGKNTNAVTVGASGAVNITVPGSGGQGWVCYAPFNANGPASGDAVTVRSTNGATLPTIPWVVPAGRDGAAKPVRNITRITNNAVNIDVAYTEPGQGGEVVNNVLVKWGQGRNLNAAAADYTGQDTVTGGYEQASLVGTRQYRLVADLTGVPEGLHTIRARAFNGRTGKPALFQTFTKTVYVDRRGPDLAFENLSEGETVQGARVLTINNADRTLYNLTYSVDGGAAQQADEVIKGKWRIALDNLAAGAHSITLNATEADYGSSRSVINTSSLTRNFTIDTAGPSIAINHAANASLTEPFFKTVVTVPTGQGITASDIKLYWDGYEQAALTENPAGSGKFEIAFDGRYVTGGVTKQFTGAFVNGPHFFEAVVTKGGQEHRTAKRVVFNLYGQNMQDSDGDGLPDEVELSGFLNGTNPGPDQAWPGDSSMDLIPNYGETWTRLNPMNADTDYVTRSGASGGWDGDEDWDGDGVSNLQEVIKGFRISGNPYQYSIYNASSVPPASVGSFSSSSLSVTNGVKYLTVIYRPNDGALSGASAVTINLTPTGAGSAQSFTMTGGPAEFTYTYAVPAGATSVSYTFSNGGTTDTSGGAAWAASTSAGFQMDGEFDSPNFIVADNGMRIYAAVRGNKLYTATWSTKGGGNDHFIFITDQFGNPVNHPWAKAGKVYVNTSTKPWIGANPTNAYANNFGTSGRSWLGDQGKALETEIDLVQVFGSVPKTLFIAVGAYPRADGGSLLSQAPASFGNAANDIEIPEFQAVNTASIRDEDLDGTFDTGNPDMKVVVNGNESDGNYGLRRFYLDEVAGDTASLTVRFKPNAGTAAVVSNVEAFTNLNRRDNAVLEEDPSSVGASTDTYYRAYPMSGPDASGYYTVDLPVNLCGAYRLQVRYKIAGVNGGNYIYYTDNAQRRDCAVVVSPKKALEMNMYEVNPLVVEAKDTTFAGRSTFQDLVQTGGYDGRPDALNQAHYSSMGINMLWLQPIHPIGIEGRDTDPSTGQAFDPGSPYAVRDYWSVNPILGRGAGTNPAVAMAEFRNFVSQLDQWGVGVMMDGTFNHSSPDAVMGQGAVDLGITNNSSVQVRNFNPGWYAKEGFPAQPATNASEIAVAPDRNDFGNWTDVREFYFGDYDALVKEKGAQNPDKSYPDNAYKLAFLLERDKFEGFTNNAIRQVWNYFSYYPTYWLEQTGLTNGTPKSQSYKGIDGLRCDFAQGLPSQFWEYTINKTRSRKWDFIFMAESLDGFREVGGSKRHGVGYRSARHFDVLNENVVFYWRDTFFGYPANGGAGTVKTPDTYQTFKAFDDRRNAFDNVVLLNNLVGHDEVFPHNDPYRLAYAYAQISALDGSPMLFYGQEAGAQNSKTGYGASEGNFGAISANRNFAKYETNFGKVIPNFKVYNQMTNIWNGATRDWTLQAFYGRINNARLNSPALRSQNVYFLGQKSTNGGYDSRIFAVGKVKTPGLPIQDAAQDVRFVFVNNNHLANTNVANTFDLNAASPTGSANYFGIERGRTYNVRDLASEKPASFVWGTAKTGADLLDNGLYVGLPYLPAGGTNSFQAHLLQIVDVTAPTLTLSFPSEAVYGTNVTLSSANSANAAVAYSLVGGDTNKASLNGDQLTVNSGTGSVTIRAVLAATADRPGATNSASISFAKAPQTITFTLSPDTANVGDPARVLNPTSTSGRTPALASSQTNVASLVGNTLTIKAAGSTDITASDAGDDNYLPATSVVRTLTVAAASSFDSLFPGQTPGSDMNGDGVPAIVEYALGGAAGSNNFAILPQMVVSNKILSVSALVRTNDPKLSVFPQSSTNINSQAWSSSGFTTNATTSGAANGFERRTYIYDASPNAQTFIRLQFRLEP